MPPYDPYFRNSLDPRNNPNIIRRSRPVRRIKVRRAGEPASASEIPQEDERQIMNEQQERNPSISTDQIDQQQDVNWQEQFARLQADLENTKKRIEKRFTQRSDDLRVQMLQDFLPLADHLEAALAHSAEGESNDGLRLGVELTLKSFLDTLGKYGVQIIDPVGEEFNPELHEAVGVINDPNTPSGHVVKVMQRGYTIDGRVIRPARVLVAQ